MKTYYFTSPTAQATQLGTTGRLFKKQVLPLGEWVDPLFPEDKMVFTSEFLQRMVDNFKAGVAGRVATPSFHTDDSQFNKGEVVDVELEDDGLYAYVDIRDDETARNIENDTIWDVSAKFTDDYRDTKTGTWYGPTLLHLALVNNPYIKKMNPFKALAESLHQQLGGEVRALSESQTLKEESMTKVTNNRDFPVEVTLGEGEEEKKVTLQPGEELEVAEDAVAGVTEQIEKAEAPTPVEGEEENEEEEAADEDKSEDDDADKEVKTEELSDTARELAEARRELAERKIDDEYKRLLGEGKMVPAMEQPFKELSAALVGQSRELSDGKVEALSDVLTRFTESMPKIVELNEESGKTGDDNPNKSPWQKLSDDVRERLQASGITEERYNKTGGKNGFSVAELTKKDEE